MSRPGHLGPTDNMTTATVTFAAAKDNVITQCPQWQCRRHGHVGWRLTHGPARLARLVRHCVRSVSNYPCSPRSAPFPPPPPQPALCSAASSVIRGCLTSHGRSSQACGLGLPRASRPAIIRAGSRGTSRFSRMKIPYMLRFSDRAGPGRDSRITPRSVLPSVIPTTWASRTNLISRLNSPACTCPCQRFTCALANAGA